MAESNYWNAFLDRLMEDLLPLPRSLTGDGNRLSLQTIQREIPVEIHEVPSGTRVLDWTVPDEWNLHRAVLRNPAGEVIADTDESTLHVVGYSEPIHHTLQRAELEPHLHSLPQQPSWIPYRTSYYERRWGFCLSDNARRALTPGRYDAHIDATLGPGSMTYGELVVRGHSTTEVLICTHICHPQMANDNLTGMAAATMLAQCALQREPKLTYRFLFIPSAIGAVTWLALNRASVNKIGHGLVLAGLGDPGPLLYKRSRRGDSITDAEMTTLLTDRGATIDWYPYGYNERQFCSPGFDLPIGRLSRSMHGTYPEYHTSADDLAFIDAVQVREAVELVLELFELLEEHVTPRSRKPHGEPHLADHGLFRAVGGALTADAPEHAYLWILSHR